METQNKTAEEELRKENIQQIVEQVEIWLETDPQNRAAIIIFNEDISDGKTSVTELLQGSEINLLGSLDHLLKNKVFRKLFSKLITIKSMLSGDE